jgi:hypothetical protein
MRVGLMCLMLAVAPVGAQALEVWLASTERCNSCALYERAAQRHGYGRALRYADRGGLTIPILSIDKGVLAEDVLAQLPPEEGPENPYWDITLTVFVMDVDRVLFAANVAESADNNELRQPASVMFPPEAPADDDPALTATDPYAGFFVAHWNLEYFVDVALGKRPRPRRGPARPVNLAALEPAALGARNVVLWGSAGTPLANALFIPTRLGEIRARLEDLALPPVRYFTLFGHGPGVQGNDTSYLVDGRTRFEHADVPADFAADADGLNRVLTAVLRTDGARTLLVQVGHSGPTGSPLWGHGLTLTADDLAPIAREGAGELVMISGACHSGLFAKAVQCGFFAAHPEVIAAGCQLSPAALESSDDYLRLLFTAATQRPANARGRRGRPAPLPTLYDAHWRAAVDLEDQEIAYTTTDALIDDYFAAHPEAVPASLTAGELRDLARAALPAEAQAVTALTAGLADADEIPLTGYVATNHAAVEKLADARELPSAERNRIVALPYKLMLPLIARRLVYAGLHVDDAQFSLAAQCEQQSLETLLGPP